MRRFVPIIIVFFGIGAGTTAALYEYSDLQERDEFSGKKSAVQQMSDDLNQNAPTMIDEYTRLDSAEVASGFALIYNYSVFGNLSPEENRAMIRQLRAYQLHEARDNPAMNVLRENEIDLIYVYRNEEGAEIGRILLQHGQY